MSSTRETNLWKWLKKLRKVYREDLHMHRVENSASPGMPDVEGNFFGNQFWLELKCEARPADPDTPIKCRFEPGQLPWLRKRVLAGGRAFVLLQVDKGAAASRYLIEGGDDAYRMEEGLTEYELGRLSLIPIPDAVANYIIQRASGHA